MPRYGGKSLKNLEEKRVPIIEYNDAAPNMLKRKRKTLEKDAKFVMNNLPETDPFTKKKDVRKEVVKAEKLRNNANEFRAKKEDQRLNKDTHDADIYIRDKKKHNQAQIQKALKKAQKSTNSAGVYDRQFKEEKVLKKMRKDKPLSNIGKEIDRNMKMIDRLSLEEQKVKLTKRIEHKLGNVDYADEKKIKRSFKKKLDKESEKRVRKSTEKGNFKKKGHAKK